MERSAAAVLRPIFLGLAARYRGSPSLRICEIRGEVDTRIRREHRSFACRSPDTARSSVFLGNVGRRCAVKLSVHLPVKLPSKAFLSSGDRVESDDEPDNTYPLEGNSL